MAILKDITPSMLGGGTITGAYHRIRSIELRFKSDARGEMDDGFDESRSEKEVRYDVDVEIYANETVRNTTREQIDGHQYELPMSCLITASGEDSLVKSAYEYLKTGESEMTGGIDA